jgi:hypothetical protein
MTPRAAARHSLHGVDSKRLTSSMNAFGVTDGNPMVFVGRTTTAGGRSTRAMRHAEFRFYEELNDFWLASVPTA